MAEMTARRIKGNSNVTLRSVYFGATEAENFAAKQTITQKQKLIQNIVR